MVRLVGSSKPGAIETDRAWWLLHERVVLTGAVCKELLDCANDRFVGRRPRAALDLFVGGWANAMRRPARRIRRTGMS